MPKWILECVKCGNGFDYCRISDDTMPLDLPLKPHVANGGRCVCPICNRSAIYKRTDLLYRPESMGMVSDRDAVFVASRLR
jgi:hypothetical protein